MLTGNYEPIKGSGERYQPTTGETMLASFKRNFIEGTSLIPGIGEEKRKIANDRVEALELESSKTKGLGQQSATFIAGLAGSILNPIGAVAGEVGGLAAKPLIKGVGLIGSYAPSSTKALLTKPVSELVSSRLPDFVGKETIASLGSKGVSGYAIATGFSLPSEIARTYNPESDSFNYFGGVKAATADGGIGLLLMSVPYLGGVLWGKIFKGKVGHEAMPLPGEKSKVFNTEHIEKAVEEKKITPAEGKWLNDYITKSKSPAELSQDASKILLDNDHPVDVATNQVMFKMLEKDDVENYHTAVADKIASELPENIKPLYQDFIGNSKLDSLRSDPLSSSVNNGLRGTVAFIKKRLEKMPEEMVEFHKIVKKLLPSSLREENPLTQKKLLKAEREGGAGFTVPEQVEKRFKQETKIKRLEQQNNDYGKELRKTGKQRYQKLIDRNVERIDEMKNKLEPILSHDEEMKHLRSKLIKNNKVVDNFKASREYRRLLDLTKVRNDARALMHELHLKHEYEMHEAYATILDTISKVMKSEFGNFAKPENVNDYMRERIQRSSPEFKNLELADVKKEVAEAKEKVDTAMKDVKTPEGREQAVKALDEEIGESGSKETKGEYDQIKNQMGEFKEKEGIFAKLIDCVLGATNG